ncbi:MAG: presenilin family intramembrane aspartyl protease [Nitrososphaerota archaeon]|nr:presenilin family intramembrane aspartyl protease [Nitrososphaerota archaeon]
MDAPRIANLINYLPVFLTIFMTWTFSSILISSDVKFDKPIITPLEEPEPSTPPAEALSNPAPYLNTLVFIMIITISGIGLLYFARRKPRFFKVLITLLIWVISFGITTLYTLISTLTFQLYSFYLLLISSSVIATLVAYSIIKGGELKSSTASAYIASGAGVVVGVSLPYWTFLVLIIGISIYDIIAVFKGHLSSITKMDAPVLKGLIVEIGDVAVGLGDLFFYSLTISAIYLNHGLISAIASSISIIIGYMIVLYSLSKRRQLPGLPIPLLLALASTFILSILSR